MGFNGSLLLLVSLVPGQLPADEPKAPLQEIYYSLKGGPANNAAFALEGPNAENCVHFESEGLRITLPAGPPGAHSDTAAAVHFPIRGDFEITASFEILQEPDPADAPSPQARCTLGVGLERPGGGLLSVTRGVERGSGTRFFAWLSLPDELTGQKQTKARAVPTKAKSGRLRLAREGSTIAYYGAEGDNAEFSRFAQYPVGREDVKNLHLSASKGASSAAFDVRFTDLHIRAESVASATSAVATLPAREGRSWLAAVVVAALLAAFSVAVGVRHYAQRHRSFQDVSG